MRRVWRWWTVRRLVLVALVVAASGSVVAGAAHWSIGSSADGRVYTVDDVPSKPVVLVLGAGVMPNGEPSPFLSARLDLGRELYESGKAQAILVSGDNGQQEYNEVDPMRSWLIDRGVPDQVVVGDYAGFDTYDSCVRAREVFGVTSLIVVTQSYHVERAVALCADAGIDTVGVGDDTVRDYTRAWKWAATREYGADVKAVLDIWSDRDPVFLGREETGVTDALTYSQEH